MVKDLRAPMAREHTRHDVSNNALRRTRAEATQSRKHVRGHAEQTYVFDQFKDSNYVVNDPIPGQTEEAVFTRVVGTKRGCM